jgi:hypothetical protein
MMPVISAETVAWIVLCLSGFYLLDRLIIWAVGGVVQRYRTGRRRAPRGEPGADDPGA